MQETFLKFYSTNNKNYYVNRVTVVVNSCDAYSDVLKIFFKALDEYWPELPFPVIVNTESSPILKCNQAEKKKKPWGARIIDVLKSIKTEYVIMVFDDFILEDYVDIEKIYSALDVLKNDINSSVFYLNAACVKDHKDDPLFDYRLLKDGVDYRLNSVPSIWKRKDLIGFTGSLDNPWSWEIFGSFRTFNKNKNFYSASSQAKNIFIYNYKKGGAIYRGKWVRDVVQPLINKYGLDIDLNERGFCDFEEKISRPLIWKINFLILGFRTIKFSMFKFLMNYLKHKLFGI